MKKYDVIIIGSGLSGLSCAVMLSKEGLNVCVVEQHHVYGGCLQSFTRGGQIFDTGIHYVGSMDDGQIMRQYFKYFGINDKIKTLRLDSNAYETLNIEGREYCIPLSAERFVNQLSEYFPSQRDGIKRFINKVYEIKNSIGVDLLRKGIISLDNVRNNMAVSTNQVIEDCVTDNVLRGILAGNSLLYGGEKANSNFYSYSMVVGTNIEGSYKFLGGTQTIANAMVEQIKANGGEVITNGRVKRIALSDNKVSHIEIENHDPICAQNYISSIHPAQTFNMLDRISTIKKAYINRLNDLNNSYGVFTTYIKLKEQTLAYRNTNIYIHQTPDTWSYPDKKNRSILICLTPSEDLKYAVAATILIPMYHSEFAEWDNTTIGQRPLSYDIFKQQKAEECINIVETHYPGFKSCIDKTYTSSPLTFRDYTSTPNGTAYGIIKNFANPLPTMFSVRTKIPNLLLTGQSLYVHGAIGVLLTSTLTCAEIVGGEYLAKKIGQ